MIHPATKTLRVEIDPKAIGQRIAEARRSREWKQADLAAAVGVKEGTVSNWEGGHRVPPLRMIVALCIHLRRSSDWILCGAKRRGAIHRMAKLRENHGSNSN